VRKKLLHSFFGRSWEFLTPELTKFLRHAENRPRCAINLIISQTVKRDEGTWHVYTVYVCNE